jgi:glycosyltransferase involved in cell wall biosynthesis
LATDEELFFPMDVEKEYDVILTGIVSPPRVEVLRQLKGLKLAVFGPWELGWKDYPEFHDIYKGCVETEAELNVLYNKSKVCIDASSPQNLNSANFTVFNAMASGCVLVSNYKPALDDLFGEEMPPTFKEDCREVVEKFVNDPELAEKESDRQRQVILNGHTFGHRVQFLLEESMKTPPLSLPEEDAKLFQEFMNSQ